MGGFLKKRRESRRINCGGIFTRIHHARKAKNISSSRIFPETLVYIALNNSRNRLAATSMFLMRLFLHIYPLANDYFFSQYSHIHKHVWAHVTIFHYLTHRIYTSFSVSRQLIAVMSLLKLNI